MGFTCGFVGLPNVGKSTIFNALTGGKAAAANFPFCTIEPNTGIVPVPDERLSTLAKLEKSKSVVPTTLQFIDIAGLVKGASKGEGLGNQFLGNIRNVDAIAHVVRLFDDANIVHVSGKISPVDDLEIIMTELMLSDLESLEKRFERNKKQFRTGDADTKFEAEIIQKCIVQLSDGKIPTFPADDEKARLVAQNLGLICTMPAFICVNIDEALLENFQEHPAAKALIAYAKEHNMEVVPICGSLESEIATLDPAEAREFMDDLGIKESCLSKVIHMGYKLLGQITYFTSGPQETRAWTIKAGTKAPQAAAKIHTDMERGFIRMEVVSYVDLVQYGSWNNAKLAGKLRIEGKDYVVLDGDSVFIRFSV